MATDNQIRAWLKANPQATDAQIYEAMVANNVTPAQLAQVVNLPAEQVQQRYNAVAPQPAQPAAPQAPTVAQQAMSTPTGLYGSEQALGAGYESALNSLLAGIEQSRADMTNQSQAAQGTISAALQQALSGLQSSGDLAAQQAREGYQQAQQGFQQAQQYLSPYATQGQQVNPLLMALTGARGQEAFNQAFLESPVQQFLQERGNRAIAANAAATGGLGGANVQKEFMRYNQGIASQALQDQINNLMGLSNQGYNAAGNQANLAASGANLAASGANLLSGITQNTGINRANLGMSGAGTVAGLQSGLGQSLGNLGLTGGLNAANYAMNTGQNLAAGRTQAGRDLAAAIGNATGSAANVAQQQGAQIADLYGATSGNLANLLSGFGGNQAALMQWLAGNQAQAAQNASGQFSGVPNTAMLPANNLQSFASLLGGVGTMLGEL